MTESTEDCINFERLERRVLNQHFEWLYGREANAVLASARPYTSRRLPLLPPGTVQESATTLDSFNRVPTRFREFSPHQKSPSMEFQGDWENLPVMVFAYLKQAITMEKLWELRTVCKTWKSYIESEVDFLEMQYTLTDEQPPSSFPLRFQHLQSLTISDGCQLKYDDALKLFASRDLERLRLEHFESVSAFAFDAVVQTGCSRLKELELIDCHVDIYALIPIGAFKNLISLNLTRSEITDDGWRPLACSLTNLKQVVLSGCHRLSDAIFDSIGSSLQKLQGLDVSEIPLLKFECFDRLQDHKNIEKLNISYCCPSPTGFEQIAKVSSIKSLELTFDSSQKTGIKSFVENRSPVGLSELIVHTNRDCIFCEIVDTLGGLKVTENLELRGFAFSAVQLQRLCSAEQWIKELKSLTFLPGHCTLHYRPLPELTFLQEQLQVLKFSKWTGVRKQFLEQIVDSCFQLKVLHLQQCPNLVDNALIKVTQLPCLEELDISGSALLTQKGVGGLKRAALLKRLIMRDLPKVQDSGLYGLKGSKTIAEIDVSGCESITMSGLTALVLMHSLESLTANNLAYLCNGCARWSLQRKAANMKLRVYWGDQASE